MVGLKTVFIAAFLNGNVAPVPDTNELVRTMNLNGTTETIPGSSIVTINLQNLTTPEELAKQFNEKVSAPSRLNGTRCRATIYPVAAHTQIAKGVSFQNPALMLVADCYKQT